MAISKSADLTDTHPDWDVKSGVAQIIEARAAEQMTAVRELFREYAASLEIDLCFQGFEQELADLPGRYAPPDGRLFLAVHGCEMMGCVGVRKIAKDTCEMKRLFLRPSFRGARMGRALATRAVEAARTIGYARMRLDTLASMKEAIALYESLGFHRIEAYYDNPSDCAIFMELKL